MNNRILGRFILSKFLRYEGKNRLSLGAGSRYGFGVRGLIEDTRCTAGGAYCRRCIDTRRGYLQQQSRDRHMQLRRVYLDYRIYNLRSILRKWSPCGYSSSKKSFPILSFFGALVGSRTLVTVVTSHLVYPPPGQEQISFIIR